MKKIISIFILFFAFSFSVNAQDNAKANPEIAAKNDIIALSDFMKLDNQTTDALFGLFVYKHNKIANGFKNEIEKNNFTDKVAKKLEGTIGTDKYAKIKENKELFKRLTH